MSIVKLNNRGVRSATTFGSISALGEMRFIKKLTASSSATISFVDGTSDVVLDNTYKEYLFTFNNIHLSTSTEPDFLVNFSSDGGSNYNVTKTSTSFYARHAENDDFASLSYDTGSDLAQSTANQYIGLNAEGTDNDGSLSGFMHLYNPSSTTFVKHFIGTISYMQDYPAAWQQNFAGYCNTTSAIDAVRFYGEYSEGSSSTIDAGDICLYGIN